MLHKMFLNFGLITTRLAVEVCAIFATNHFTTLIAPFHFPGTRLVFARWRWRYASRKRNSREVEPLGNLIASTTGAGVKVSQEGVRGDVGR